MGDQTNLEAEIQHLKGAVRAKQAPTETGQGDPVVRRVRKKLKRAQRKRRKLLLRRQHAGHKNKATT